MGHVASTGVPVLTDGDASRNAKRAPLCTSSQAIVNKWLAKLAPESGRAQTLIPHRPTDSCHEATAPIKRTSRRSWVTRRDARAASINQLFWFAANQADTLKFRGSSSYTRFRAKRPVVGKYGGGSLAAHAL